VAEGTSELPDLQTLARLLGGTINGDQILAPGPGHSSIDKSLSVKLDVNAPDGFVVNTFSPKDDPIACRDYVREKVGLAPFQPNGRKHQQLSEDFIKAAVMAAATGQSYSSKAKGHIVATYAYTDANGKLLYQALRYEPKDFRQRRPDGNGGWIWKLNDHRVLYRWPELLKFPDATVFVTEGEKDANRVAELGHCTTCVAAGKWTDDCIKALAGRDVVILEDNDAAGREKALEAAQVLHGTANTIRIVSLPDLPDKGDVSDWLDANPHNAKKFVDVCFNAPLWNTADTETETACTEGDNVTIRPKTDQHSRADKSEPEKHPSLPFINLSNWDNEPVPDQDWIVRDRIPCRQSVLFSGEGAAGKSTLQLQLSAAHVLARDWLGTLPEPGPAIYIDAEDDGNVLHRRLAAIIKHYQVTFSDIVKGGLHLISLAGQDAVLAAAGRKGKIESTTLYKQLLEAAADIKPKMIGIASSANVYAGSEIERTQVQQFIGLLTRLAIAANGAVVLISHPSLAGISTDTGLSGNTQWHNAVRARFYLKGVKPESGDQTDADLRELVFKKNNYGPVSENIVLRYQKGLFLPVGGTSTLEKAAAEQVAEQLFLTLLLRFTQQGRNVSDKPTSHGYAPTNFAADPEAKSAHVTKAAFADAMQRLFAADKIHVETYGRPSRQASKLMIGSCRT
jgi:RecA-family ATPase